LLRRAHVTATSQMARAVRDRRAARLLIVNLAPSA
jgi:hypothetical protein